MECCAEGLFKDGTYGGIVAAVVRRGAGQGAESDDYAVGTVDQLDGQDAGIISFNMVQLNSVVKRLMVDRLVRPIHKVYSPIL